MRGFGIGFGACSGFGFMPMGLFLIFIGISILAVVWFMQNNKKKEHDEVLVLLNTKYANGEISEEEYLKRKENILRK